MAAAAAPPDAADAGFRHQALLYDGATDYADGICAFLVDGLAEGEATFVAVPRQHATVLCDGLGDDADKVAFADMAVVGRNPSRIIPAIRRFVDAAGSRRVRFVGEPIWSGRTDAEIVEATRHEALLNVAFADRAMTILCPYDVRALPTAVVDDSYRTHPEMIARDGARASHAYADPMAVAAAAAWPLPEPPQTVAVMPFDGHSLAALRPLLRHQAARAGLRRTQVDDLLLATNEIATNTAVHGPGHGTVRVWCDDRSLVCEVSDRGVIGDPLAGRHAPHASAEGGRGLWFANQLCDLVEMRSGAGGTVIRLHIHR